MRERPLLTYGSTYYSLSSCYDENGDMVAYRVNNWRLATDCAYLPADYCYRTEEGLVKVRYFLTEKEIRDVLYPMKRKPKAKHRIAKALILGIAAMAGMEMDTL